MLRREKHSLSMRSMKFRRGSGKIVDCNLEDLLKEKVAVGATH